MGIIQNRLKQYRKQNKWTQAEFAKILGVTQQTYQEWESGKIEDLRSSTIIRICQATKMSADWLLGLRETKLITEFDPSFKAIMTAQTDVPVKGILIPGKKKEEKTVIQPLATATADE